MNVKMKRLLLVFFLFQMALSPLSATENYKYEIAICAIFQNEASYLKEWIEFHKLVGVKHFYLYNNLSTDQYYQVLLPYLLKGEVELFQWGYNTNPDGGNWPTIQNMAYNHALNLARGQVKWLAIIDTDEFLFPVQVDDLPAFLKNFEGVPAVCVNWQLYGTSCVERILPGHLLIEDLIYKGPTTYIENTHVKSIVRPEFVDSCINPHYCLYLSGLAQVNSNQEPFSGPFSPVLVDQIRINHYWTRDLNFFRNVKIPRRKKWQDEAFLERANNLNQEVDTSIHKYCERLKRQLKNFSH